MWLGLDNGISNINFKAPFRVYKDDLGILGTVYTTFLINDNDKIDHNFYMIEYNPTQRNVTEDKKYEFIVFWNNRNIRRKLPGDVIMAYKQFCDMFLSYLPYTVFEYMCFTPI